MLLVPLNIPASAGAAADTFASNATPVHLSPNSSCVIDNNRCAVQAGLESVHSSETMIVRNLLNLVTNAVKHTVRGEIHVAAGFKVFPDRPGTVFIEFKVSDTGTGICKEYRGANSETVWMPFESGAKSTGLGLFVVKRSLIILLVRNLSD